MTICIRAFTLLTDPQTNGSLLFSVKEESLEKVKDVLTKKRLKNFTEVIGRMIPKNDKVVIVKP